MLWRQVECWPWKVEVHSIFLQSCCRRQTMNPDLREVAWNLPLLCAISKTTRFDDNCSNVPISKRRNSTILLLALVAVLGLAEGNWWGWNDVIRPTSLLRRSWLKTEEESFKSETLTWEEEFSRCQRKLADPEPTSRVTTTPVTLMVVTLTPITTQVCNLVQIIRYRDEKLNFFRWRQV